MSMNDKVGKKSFLGSIEPWVFLPPLIFVIALVAWVINDPAAAGSILSGIAFGTICFDWGWFFEWYVFIIAIICVFLCIHPIGKKNLAKKNRNFQHSPGLA